MHMKVEKSETNENKTCMYI